MKRTPASARFVIILIAVGAIAPCGLSVRTVRAHEEAGRFQGTGKTPPAEPYVRKAENTAPFARAVHAAENGDYRTSTRLFREIIARDPGDFEALSELGTIQFRQRKYSDADDSYRQALRLRPSHIPLLLNLGKLQLARKKYSDAVATLRQVVEADPQSPQGQFFLGEAYLQIKRGSRAAVHFNEALRLDPVGMAQSHLRLGALFNAAGQKDRAAAEYEQFLAIKPDYPEKQKLLKYIKTHRK